MANKKLWRKSSYEANKSGSGIAKKIWTLAVLFWYKISTDSIVILHVIDGKMNHSLPIPKHVARLFLVALKAQQMGWLKIYISIWQVGTS